MALYSEPPVRYLPWLYRAVGLEGNGPQWVQLLKHGADRSRRDMFRVLRAKIHAFSWSVRDDLPYS